METTHADSEFLIPDQVIDHRFQTLIDVDGRPRRSDSPTTLTWRQKLGATLLLMVLAIAALGIATLVALGAFVVAAVLLVVGVTTRVALAISGKTVR